MAGDGRVACRNWICALVLVTVEGRVKKRCTLQIKMCVCKRYTIKLGVKLKVKAR